MMLSLIGLCISGCGEDKKDHALYQFIREIKLNPFKGLHKVAAFEFKDYSESLDQLKRDPFYKQDNAHFESAAGFKLPYNDLNINEFSIDTLSLVGSIRTDNNIWALIKAPDDSIYPVTVGEVIGTQAAQVIMIEENALYLLYPTYTDVDTDLEQNVKVMKINVPS